MAWMEAAMMAAERREMMVERERRKVISSVVGVRVEGCCAERVSMDLTKSGEESLDWG
jgi:hypothetical protein